MWHEETKLKDDLNIKGDSLVMQAPTRLVELELLVTGVDGDGHGSDGGQSNHQGALVADGEVDEACVIGGVELGVIVAITILEQNKHKSFRLKNKNTEK